ncbi:hypothetical protein EDC04DRAFT_2609954 [Pisolithus marmoratus]|nr:hypothetical protein EDC04DRAFT_2609954 [Pisolithus marmoratus]
MVIAGEIQQSPGLSAVHSTYILIGGSSFLGRENMSDHWDEVHISSPHAVHESPISSNPVEIRASGDVILEEAGLGVYHLRGKLPAHIPHDPVSGHQMDVATHP